MKKIAAVKTSTEDARRNYNRLSRHYDRLADRSERKFRTRGIELLKVTEGEHILELGFGTGHGLAELTRLTGEKGRVTGVDISPGMMEVTKNRLEREGLSHRADLHLMDGRKLDFPAHSFDGIFLCFTLELFPTADIPVVLEQCSRSLKEGGRIVVVAMSRGNDWNPMVQIYEAVHRIFPRRVDCRPIYPGEALEEAGFRVDQEVIESIWGIPVEIVIGRKGEIPHPRT